MTCISTCLILETKFQCVSVIREKTINIFLFKNRQDNEKANERTNYNKQTILTYPSIFVLFLDYKCQS